MHRGVCRTRVALACLLPALIAGLSFPTKGKAPPEFMSTHPADETRISQIRQALPEAMKHYRPAR